MDFTDYGAEQTLQWVLEQGAPVPPAALFIKLHISDPGPTGNANPAVNTERQPVDFDTIVSPGIPTDGSADADTLGTSTWIQIPESETYSHLSLWDDEVEGQGNAWYKMALLDPVDVLEGGSFEFQTGNGLLRHN